MPTRNKRNASERKCLSPEMKIMFRNHPKAVMRTMFEIEKANKTKPSQLRKEHNKIAKESGTE